MIKFWVPEKITANARNFVVGVEIEFQMPAVAAKFITKCSLFIQKPHTDPMPEQMFNVELMSIAFLKPRLHKADVVSSPITPGYRGREIGYA